MQNSARSDSQFIGIQKTSELAPAVVR